MPADWKLQMKEGYATAFEGRDECVVFDFGDASAQDVTEMRTQFRGTGMCWLVVRDSVVRRAMENTPLGPLAEHVTGRSAVAFGEGDVAEAIRKLSDWSDQGIVIRACVVDGDVFTGVQIKRLAATPPKDVLLGQIAGAIAQGIAGIAIAVQEVPAGIARAVAALGENE